MDDESKLTLHGLVQHYVMLHEEEKNRKLTDLLDALDFNQVGRGGVAVCHDDTPDAVLTTGWRCRWCYQCRNQMCGCLVAVGRVVLLSKLQ